MIRRNLVAVVATCSALAVGIALGAGPLSDLDHAQSDERPQSAGAGGDLSRRAALDERFIGDSAAALLAKRLSGQRVAVIALPGVDADVVDGISTRIKSGGGTVTSVVRVAASMLDPGRKTYLDELGSKLVPQLKGRVNASLDTYARFGQILGSAYGGKTATGSFDAGQSTAAKTMTTAKLATVSGGKTPATLLLVLVGKPVDPTALTGIVHGLGGASHAVVAAGPSSSTALAALRRQGWGPWFASVDGVETPTGQVAAALVLARQVSQSGGNFGASGFGGLVDLR